MYDKHRESFLDLLNEITILFGVKIHSYCLMDNHYHLLLETPHSNLSKAMRHLNGLYNEGRAKRCKCPYMTINLLTSLPHEYLTN